MSYTSLVMFLQTRAPTSYYEGELPHRLACEQLEVDARIAQPGERGLESTNSSVLWSSSASATHTFHRMAQRGCAQVRSRSINASRSLRLHESKGLSYTTTRHTTPQMAVRPRMSARRPPWWAWYGASHRPPPTAPRFSAFDSSPIFTFTHLHEFGLRPILSTHAVAWSGCCTRTPSSRREGAA